MTQLQAVGFRLVKAGGEPEDWEDFFAYDTGRPDSGTARCVVLDGASTAFDSQRWAGQLGRAFVGLDGSVPPGLGTAELLAWIDRMQKQWIDELDVAALDEIEELSARNGSFATFLGCQIDGLKTAEPTWRAAAFGDVVIFHIRDNCLVSDPFPISRPEAFGIDPAGIFTLTHMRPRMEDALRLSPPRALQVGDALYLASDAFAEWLIRAGGPEWWEVLGGLADRAIFGDLVRRQRAAGTLKNDDVTLLRIDVTAGDPGYFVVGG